MSSKNISFKPDPDAIAIQSAENRRVLPSFFRMQQ